MIEEDSTEARRISDRSTTNIDMSDLSSICEASGDFTTPYLDAIQKIPGEAACSKKSWIGRLGLDNSKGSGDITEVPGLMLPLARVEIAIKKKLHEDITWALKWNDWMIVKRAFNATWYFDGSFKNIVDVQYFETKVFPEVSLNTRLHIIKTLAYRLYRKDALFAEELFNTVVFTFNITQALPLLLACSEDFAYQQIVENEILLPLTILKKFFRKNPDFVVRYLKLSVSNEKSFPIRDEVYDYILPKLIKKRLPAFVELFEKFPDRSFKTLSNKCCDTFLKNGINFMMKNPRLYLPILSLPRIKAHQMEVIFPGLLPKKISKWSIYTIMEYLEYYPEEKKLNLLFESYKNKYGVEFLENPNNVTSDILKLLPVEERIKQAEIKINECLLYDDFILGNDFMNYKNTWHCYLPVSKSIPVFKAKIITATITEQRACLLSCMIYSCKVNKDETALISCLEYILQRHKSEEYWMLNRLMECIIELYDVMRLSQAVWQVLQKIVHMFYIKHGCVTPNMLVALAYHQLSVNVTINETIEMWLATMIKRHISFDHCYTSKKEYLSNDAKCLIACLSIIQEKYNCAAWKKHKDELTFEFVRAMYNFCERCNNFRKAEYKMSIEDHPWLLKKLHDIVEKDQSRLESILLIFKQYEPTLYRRWSLEFNKDDNANIASVQSGAALILLRRDPKSIENCWRQYLNVCKDACGERSVQRFIRETRWYKNIPYLFVKHCRYNYKEDKNYLVILAMLLQGDVVTKLIEPLIPQQKSVDISNSNAKSMYDNANCLPLIMKVSNPPVPLDYLMQLCAGDYMSVALRAIRNAIRRNLLPQVISFAKTLATKNVSVQKHGIRVMFIVASTQQLRDFVMHIWQQQKHISIREVLVTNAQRMFKDNPSEISWTLLFDMMSTVTSNDEAWLSQVIQREMRIPNKYETKYIKLLLDIIDILNSKRTKIIDTTCLNITLSMISDSICDLLPSELTEQIIRKYMFHKSSFISAIAIDFAVCSYLSVTSRQRDKRMETFANIFVTQVKEGWNVTGELLENAFYPVNHSVNKFIEAYVGNFLSKDKQNDNWGVSKMFKLFTSVLKPHMDARSYLILVYANEFDRSESFKKYGLKIGKKLRELVDIFSSEFTVFMHDVLSRHILNNLVFKEALYEDASEFVEGLFEAGNMESYFMAAKILSNDNLNVNCRDVLIKKLLRIDHPTIQSVIRVYLNELYQSSCDDKVNLTNHFNSSDENKQ